MCSVSALEPAALDIIILPCPDELTFCASVLALGRAGAAPLPSCRSIRIVTTPNVCDDSWYAMRLHSSSDQYTPHDHNRFTALLLGPPG